MNANATHPDESEPKDLVQRADLIFQGTVVAVEYRLSDVAAPDQVALPHTLVTYEIERRFKGSSAAGRYVTLRLRGGPDAQGNTLMIPGIPTFDVGDHDILFVGGNGAEIAPIVGGEHGRFRIIEDEIYSDTGQEVWLLGKGRIGYGQYRPHEEVITHRIGTKEFSFETTDTRKWTPPRGAQRAKAALFGEYMDGLVSRRFTTQELDDLSPAVSVDIRDSFYVAAPQPAAPPVVPEVAEANDAAAPSSGTDPLQGE